MLEIRVGCGDAVAEADAPQVKHMFETQQARHDNAVPHQNKKPRGRPLLAECGAVHPTIMSLTSRDAHATPR